LKAAAAFAIISGFAPPPRSFALEFCALASGSKGNAVFVGSRGRGVLVDVGLAGREIERRIVTSGVQPEAISAVVVTHEHRDHISGVGVWARRYRVPVYMTATCRDAASAVLGPRGLERVEVRLFEPGLAFGAGGLEFFPFSTSHDALDSVGFRVTDGSKALGIATDLGFASHVVRHHLAAADLLYLESNHDEDLLVNGPYPWFLKQRIRSRHGHLSNAASALLLGELLHGGLHTVVLAHLSETNNTPRLAYEAGRAALADCGAERDVTLLVARQDRPSRVVRL
jgi:phosphoribosyl 1,2-cyclic phosphodiesterase